jgi:hypothetical protein
MGRTMTRKWLAAGIAVVLVGLIAARRNRTD